MRAVVVDDSDSDSEWSIEIIDGGYVKPLTNLSRQTPFTSTSVSTTNKAHPASTNVVVAATRSTSQVTTKHVPDAARRAPAASDLVSHSMLKASCTMINSHQPRIYPSIVAQEPSQPVGDDREQAHFQKRHHPAKSQKATLLTWHTSSGSNDSSKLNEGESSLPVYSFMEYENVPAVVYIKSESEANRLAQTLKGPLGFDLEWRVMWQPGARERRVALVQLCDRRTILLIQVSNMKRFPSKVLEVIESADVVKTGANILNDGQKLYRDFGVRAKGLVELGVFATKADDQFSTVYNREIVSLAKMVAMYLGRTLLKGKVRISNWEANLSRSMVEYAANDCHSALMVYDRLQEIAERSGKTLNTSTYSYQINPPPLKLNHGSFPARPQSVNTRLKQPIPHYCIPEPPRPQQLRAYKLWHVDKMPLDRMCMKLRTGARVEPLKESTVISYVIGALQADSLLPFDMNDLKALVLMEASSWQRHREWIASRE